MAYGRRPGHPTRPPGHARDGDIRRPAGADNPDLRATTNCRMKARPGTFQSTHPAVENGHTASTIAHQPALQALRLLPLRNLQEPGDKLNYFTATNRSIGEILVS